MLDVAWLESGLAVLSLVALVVVIRSHLAIASEIIALIPRLQDVKIKIKWRPRDE